MRQDRARKYFLYGRRVLGVEDERHLILPMYIKFRTNTCEIGENIHVEEYQVSITQICPHSRNLHGEYRPEEAPQLNI